jgi:TonB family protein
VKCPAPPYPEIAADPRVAAEGRIELRLLVDEKGEVAVLAAVYRPLPSRRPSSPPGQKILQDAAVAAVRKWRYRPARRDGLPVPMEVTATAEFTLSK